MSHGTLHNLLPQNDSRVPDLHDMVTISQCDKEELKLELKRVKEKAKMEGQEKDRQILLLEKEVMGWG